MYGEFEDNGKFARCGYCGFTNSLDRTAVGGPTSLPGTYYTQTVITFSEGRVGLGSYTVPEVTADENWLTIDSSDYCFPASSDVPPVRQTIWVPGVSRFCAFCGSPNWYK